MYLSFKRCQFQQFTLLPNLRVDMFIGLDLSVKTRIFQVVLSSGFHLLFSVVTVFSFCANINYFLKNEFVPSILAE